MIFLFIIFLNIQKIIFSIKHININYNIYIKDIYIIYLKCFVFVLLNPEVGIVTSSFLLLFSILNDSTLSSSLFTPLLTSSNCILGLILLSLFKCFPKVQSEPDFVLSCEQQLNINFYIHLFEKNLPNYSTTNSFILSSCY